MAKNTFLFSIDLEDIRNRMPDGEKYAERVPLMVEQYLTFLEKHSSKATFFVVGDVARKYPELIHDISKAGHEIACHSNTHIEAHQQTLAEFEKDLSDCLESLYACNISSVIGYRAPVFSLTAKTEWIYSILAKSGIIYSSSVLPANNPLNGWKDFGQNPRKMGEVWEIPISVSTGMFTVPFAGGVYFRVLPFAMIKGGFRNKPLVVGYFHPYDIDTDQEKFMHPGIGNSAFYNFLLSYNRKATLPRLSKLMGGDLDIMRHDHYIQSLANEGKKP